MEPLKLSEDPVMGSQILTKNEDRFISFHLLAQGLGQGVGA
jgi:hypothetical protein